MYEDLDVLQKALGYTFKNPMQLQQALQHRSYVNENPHTALEDNETLEFLGDAVLNLVVSHVLMTSFPHKQEGDLSRTRAQLVSESRLAKVARSIDLGRHIRLGKGEAQTGGRGKPSILADTLEALLAAIYLDGGYPAAFEVIASRLAFHFEAAGSGAADTDYKSRLQEYAQTHLKMIPQYRIVEESGPDHAKTFSVELELQGLRVRGIGRSKKIAEQNAAGTALRTLTGDG